MKEIKDINKSNIENTLHIYLRVSTEIQKTDGGSLSTQLKNGKNVAKRNGFDYMVWDEGSKSGSKNNLNRIVFNKMMYEVKNGNIKRLYFQDISRSQRNYEYEYILIKTCQDYDVIVHDYSREYNVNDPNDNLQIRIQSLFGQFENQQRRLRSVLGKRDHFLRGGWRGGITPFGFDTINRRLEINKDESKWVKIIFQKYSNSESPTTISNYLFSKGVKPRKSKSGIFNVGTISVMLKNEIYIGIDKMVDPENREIIHEYKKVPKIIEKELWDKVQSQIEKNKRNRKPTTSSFPVMLRKMIYCESCGELWGVRIKKNKNTFVYYCRNRENKWSSRSPNRIIKDCKVKKSVSIRQLDNLVWSSILYVNENSHILKEEDKNEILKPINPKESNKWKKRIKLLKNKIEEYSDKKEFIYNQYLIDEITTSQLDKLNMSIKNSIKEINEEINELEGKIRFKKQKQEFIDWITIRQNYLKDLSSIDSMDEKKKVVIKILEMVTIDYNFESDTHIVKLKLKYPLFNDELVWKDENDKSKGYYFNEGEFEKTFEFKSKVGRPKKNLSINPPIISNQLQSSDFNFLLHSLFSTRNTPYFVLLYVLVR